MNGLGGRKRLLRRNAASALRKTTFCAVFALACVILLAGEALAAGATAGPAGAGSGWWLQMKNAACSQGPKVLLGDIAAPRGELSDAAWKELAARPLWNAPEKAGHQTALSRERIVALLRHYAEDLAGAVALPNQLVIQRGGKVLDSADLEKQVVTFLTERAKPLGGELDITDLHTPDYIFFASERDALTIEPSSQVRAGRVNVLFEMRGSDGKAGRRYAASAFLNVWKALPCATRGMNRLEQLNLAQVQFKRKNLAYHENAWDGSGGPWRLAKSVGIEQVIHREDIEPVPVIAKGDKVTLLYEGENLRLSVKAEALVDAGIGQTIQVRNLQSNRKITATVQDPGTVIVR